MPELEPQLPQELVLEPRRPEPLQPVPGPQQRARVPQERVQEPQELVLEPQRPVQEHRQLELPPPALVPRRVVLELQQLVQGRLASQLLR